MKTKTKLLKTLTTLASFLIYKMSAQAVFVEGPQYTYTNPTNDFVAMGFSLQTNVNIIIINQGIVSNVNNALAFGIITGTNNTSDIIRNDGTIGVIGANNGNAIGILDRGGSGNLMYNYGSIYSSAGPNGLSIGLACITSNNLFENRGLVKNSGTKGIGILMNKSTVFNFGTIDSSSNCIQELLGGGSFVGNGGTLISANGPAINLRDDIDLVLNVGPIITSHPTAIDTHGGDDTVAIGLNAPISGIIDGGSGTDTLSLVLTSLTTADTRGSLLSVVSSASPASGSFTIDNNTFNWANFETLTGAALAYTASDFNNDGFNDLVLQSKTAVQYVAMSNNAAAGSSPQNVKTLDKKERIVSVNDFNFDMKPELVVANKSSVKIFTGTNFSTSFASLTLGKGEKVVGAGDVGGTNIYVDLITRKKKEIRYYPSIGSNLITTSTLLYTEKDGYKFIGAGRFGGGSAIVLKKKGKLEYRSITNLNATGTTISLPKGYNSVIGIADYANGGDMEVVAVKGKKVAIGSKAEAYTLPKKTKLVGPR